MKCKKCGKELIYVKGLFVVNDKLVAPLKCISCGTIYDRELNELDLKS